MGLMSVIWCLSIILSTNLPLYWISHLHCIFVYLARKIRIIKTYTRDREEWYQPEILEFRELMAPNIALNCVAEYKTSRFLLGNLLVYIIILKKCKFQFGNMKTMSYVRCVHIFVLMPGNDHVCGNGRGECWYST